MNKPFAWSWSVLDMYRTCPKKYYHIKVAKDAKDQDSSFSKEGKEIHEALYQRVIHDAPLPLPMRPLEEVVAPYTMLPGEKHGEMKLALNEKLQARDFFARDVWVRGIVDYLVVNEDKCLIVDWKTGKPKDDVGQLKLTAAILSRYMPEVTKFTCAYVWVKHPDAPPTTVKLEKKHMKEVWIDALHEVKEIKEALKTTTFPANQTPLCKWCPVFQCPHNKAP
jgi:hypothetical protein